VGIGATLLAQRTEFQTLPQSLRAAVVEPFGDMFRRAGAGLLLILAFIVLLRLPDRMAGAMVVTLLRRELEFDLEEIAWIRQGLGVAMTMLGAFMGGLLLIRVPVMRAMWVLIPLQMLSNLGFAWLAMNPRDIQLLAIVVSIENICGGMITAGFVAYLMSLCNRRFSATQYALFTSLNYFTGVMTEATTGYMIGWWGFPVFFLLTVVAGLPALLLLPFLPRIDRDGGLATS